MSFWNDAKRAAMLDLLAAGHTQAEIGQLLGGVSRYAVADELHRMRARAADAARAKPAGSAPPAAPPAARGHGKRAAAGRFAPQLPAARVPAPAPIPRGVRTLPLLPSEEAALQAKAKAEADA